MIDNRAGRAASRARMPDALDVVTNVSAGNMGAPGADGLASGIDGLAKTLFKIGAEKKHELEVEQERVRQQELENLYQGTQYEVTQVIRNGVLELGEQGSDAFDKGVRDKVKELVDGMPTDDPEVRKRLRQWAVDQVDGQVFTLRVRENNLRAQQADFQSRLLIQQSVVEAQQAGVGLDEGEAMEYIANVQERLKRMAERSPTLTEDVLNALPLIEAYTMGGVFAGRAGTELRNAVMNGDNEGLIKLGEELDKASPETREIALGPYDSALNAATSIINEQVRAANPAIRRYEDEAPTAMARAEAELSVGVIPELSMLNALEEELSREGYEAESRRLRIGLEMIRDEEYYRDLFVQNREEGGSNVDQLRMHADTMPRHVLLPLAFAEGITTGDLISTDKAVLRFMKTELSALINDERYHESLALFGQMGAARHALGKTREQYELEERVMDALGIKKAKADETSLTSKINTAADFGIAAFEVGAIEHGMEVGGQLENMSDLRPGTINENAKTLRIVTKLLKMPVRPNPAQIRRDYANQPLGTQNHAIALLEAYNQRLDDVYAREVTVAQADVQTYLHMLGNPSSQIYANGTAPAALDTVNQLIERLSMVPNANISALENIRRQAQNLGEAMPHVMRVKSMSPAQIKALVRSMSQSNMNPEVKRLVMNSVEAHLHAGNLTRTIDAQELAAIRYRFEEQTTAKEIQFREMLERGDLVGATLLSNELNAMIDAYTGQDDAFGAEAVTLKSQYEGLLNGTRFFQAWGEMDEENQNLFYQTINRELPVGVSVAARDEFNRRANPIMEGRQEGAGAMDKQVGKIVQQVQSFTASPEYLQQALEFMGTENLSPNMLASIEVTSELGTAAREGGLPALRAKVREWLHNPFKLEIAKEMFDNLNAKANADPVGTFLELNVPGYMQEILPLLEGVQGLTTQIGSKGIDPEVVRGELSKFFSGYGQHMTAIRDSVWDLYGRAGVFPKDVNAILMEIMKRDTDGVVVPWMAGQIAKKFPTSNLKDVWADIGQNGRESRLLAFMGNHESEGHPDRSRMLWDGYRRIQEGLDDAAYPTKDAWQEQLRENGWLWPYLSSPTLYGDVVQMSYYANVGLHGQENREGEKVFAGPARQALMAAVGDVIWRDGDGTARSPIEVPKDMSVDDLTDVLGQGIGYLNDTWFFDDNDQEVARWIRSSLPSGVGLQMDVEELVNVIQDEKTIWVPTGQDGAYHLAWRPPENEGVGLRFAKTRDGENFTLDVKKFRKARHASGEATVVDGDTMWVGGQKIRLNGYNMAEMDSHEGRMGKARLLEMVGDKVVNCSWYTYGEHNRPLGQCYVDDVDINEEMKLIGRREGWLHNGD